MTALPIRPLAETADTVTLSRSDFEALSELVANAADLADIEAVKHKITAGETEVFPFEIAEQLLDGAHPLRVFRDYRGLTLRGLAHTVGLSASYLSEIESGIKTGSIESLHRLAAALGVSLDMLSVAKA